MSYIYIISTISHVETVLKDQKDDVVQRHKNSSSVAVFVVGGEVSKRGMGRWRTTSTLSQKRDPPILNAVSRRDSVCNLHFGWCFWSHSCFCCIESLRSTYFRSLLLHFLSCMVTVSYLHLENHGGDSRTSQIGQETAGNCWM